MSINRLHDDRAKLMRQLEDTSESLSASAHEVSHLRQQIMIQDEQKLSLQKTIADKTRQTEGLLTQIHDLRHQLNEMSESNTSKQKSVVQDISKLQQQQRELRGEIERKAEELAAVTKKKQDAEKQLSSLKKAHATEMQHVKADLTRKVNKLNREVAIRV
ncbi:liprin-beta-1-like [Corticium candelabrum]|uniref:liprin-beta-1-like n=1 Tax=Corticium candelabrum TaxID=121492 RepID=UPI002E255C32|nr:liprin-beta-1-like [Corticium candelabrum]